MRVRRRGETSVMDVFVGPSLIETRPLYPDCEMVFYVSFAGLVVMTLSVSHSWEIQGVSNSCLRDPKMVLSSAPIITHVASGSPFSMHGAAVLEGSFIKQMIGADGRTQTIETLQDVDIAIREINPIILVLDTGERVGARIQDINDYDYKQTDEALRRGTHGVMRGPMSRVVFAPMLLEDLRDSMASSVATSVEDAMTVDRDDEFRIPLGSEVATTTSAPVTKTFQTETTVQKTEDAGPNLESMIRKDASSGVNQPIQSWSRINSAISDALQGQF